MTDTQTKYALDAEIDAALARGRERLASEPRALAARYDPSTGRVTVELSNGCVFAFPARALQGLQNASDAELAEVEVAGAGFGLHWETLDADFTVPGLLMGLFGTRPWMREQARRAGKTKSPAKSAAARANGAKGGRPRGASRAS